MSKCLYLFLVLFSFKAFAQGEEVHDYIKSVYVGFTEQYIMDECEKKNCRLEAFLKKLPTSTKKNELVNYWLLSEGMQPEHRVQLACALVDRVIGDIYFVDGKTFGEDFIRWFVFRSMFFDMSFKTGSPESAAWNVVLQEKGYEVAQLEDVWALSEKLYAGKVSVDTRVGVRAALMRARMLRSLGQYETAYSLLLNVVKSKVFMEPEMISSEELQLQRAWAWSMLAASARSLYWGYSARIAETIAKPYLVGFEEKISAKERWLTKLKLTIGWSGSQDFSKAFEREPHFMDSFTEALWEHLYKKTKQYEPKNNVLEHQIYFQELELSERLKLKVKLKDL